MSAAVRPVLDVSELPTSALGARTPIWWSTLLLIIIETTTFVLVGASYLYLRRDAVGWPPAPIQPPDLLWGTLTMAVLLASLAPAVWASRVAAEPRGARAVQIALLATLAVQLLALVIRVLEFGGTHCRWDTNAYGSLLWTLLGLHTGEMIASIIETVVLVVYAFRRTLDTKHRNDILVGSMFWYFVVGVWVPMYVMLYFVPRGL